ncbi:MAG: hypothetical protein HYR94_00930 [Chloroflexi bacterium]|nr:hypothetical protein [Chloroflexota bacterium]
MLALILALVVMQTHALNPNMSATFVPDQAVPDNFRATTFEINPQGLYLEAEGLIAGTPPPLPADLLNGPFTIMPTLRNWADDGSIRSDLVDNLLIDDSARQQHIATIVSLIQKNAYRGIELDYRGISPDLRSEFTSFLEDLRAALPPDRRLVVRVELPQQLSGDAWDSGGYDWQAIGRIADVVNIPTLPELGTVVVSEGLTTAGPNQALDFTLSSLPAGASLQFDIDSGLYWLSFPPDANGQRLVYLENAASVARKLQFVAQYNLHGVSIQNLFAADSDPQIQEVVRRFLDLALSSVEGQHAVVWHVKNQEGGLIAEQIVDLTNPTFQWTTPTAAGTYQIIASTSANRNPATATPLGSVSVVVTNP